MLCFACCGRVNRMCLAECWVEDWMGDQVGRQGMEVVIVVEVGMQRMMMHHFVR